MSWPLFYSCEGHHDHGNSHKINRLIRTCLQCQQCSLSSSLAGHGDMQTGREMERGLRPVCADPQAGSRERHWASLRL